MDTFLLLLPICGIIAFGYFLHRYHIVKSNWIKTLNLFVYYVSLPALIITLFWKIEFTTSTLSFLGFHAILIIVLSLLLVLFLSLFSINNNTKIAVVLGVMVGNTIYMGYPILQSAYPAFPIEVSMGAGTIQLIVGLLMGVFLVEYMVLKTKKSSVYFLDLAKNPLVIAVIAGVLLNLVAHNQIVNEIFKPISLLGETASPLALFTLGAFMYRKFSKQSWMLGGFAIVAKLAIFPLVVFLISSLLGYSKEYIQISVLISAMPTAVTGFILAEKYNLNDQLAADIILVTTILSIISIPMVTWLLG